MILCLFFILIFTLSAVFAWFIRRYSISHAIIDIPNERSSHSIPTPRGGGLAIAGITLGGLVIAWLYQPDCAWPELLAYLAGSLLIAIISWLDDLYTISSCLRFCVHGLAAFIIIAGFGFWKTIVLPVFGQIELSWLGLAITFLWIVGLTNSYNFMDGIDGIAGCQAVVAGVGWIVLGKAIEFPLVEVLGALLAAASLGFLLLNWPPARIFMGDVGSAFLGYSFACLTLIGSKKEPSLALAGVLLVWPFVFDAGFTFFRRLKNKEKIFAPHRSHLYQRLVLSGCKHQTVTLLYLGFDLLGLMLALMIMAKKSWLDLTVVIAVSLACFGLWWVTIIRERRAIPLPIVKTKI